MPDEEAGAGGLAASPPSPTPGAEEMTGTFVVVLCDAVLSVVESVVTDAGRTDPIVDVEVACVVAITGELLDGGEGPGDARIGGDVCVQCKRAAECGKERKASVESHVPSWNTQLWLHLSSCSMH